MKIIVGLGNPGRNYKNNRHNLGFRIIDGLSGKLDIPVDKKKFNSEYGKKKSEMLFVKPTTFMNDSGRVVAAWVNYYRVDLKDLLIICDDFTLDLGLLRFRRSGTHGGHNGLKSVISCLGSNQFSRLRMGVGGPGKIPGTEFTEDPADYVLGDFADDEKGCVVKMISCACDAVVEFTGNGIDDAMNNYNRHVEDMGITAKEKKQR